MYIIEKGHMYEIHSAFAAPTPDMTATQTHTAKGVRFPHRFRIHFIRSNVMCVCSSIDFDVCMFTFDKAFFYIGTVLTNLFLFLPLQLFNISLGVDWLPPLQNG